MRLADGRQVVAEVRRWEDRLVACGQVQHRFATADFPSSDLLAGPDRFGSLGVTHGACTATLQSTRMGPRLYSSLGFEAVGRYEEWAPG